MDSEELEALCTSLSIKEQEGPMLALDRDRRRVADEGVAGTGKARSMGSGGHGGREGSILDDAVRGSRGLHSKDLERMGDGLIFNEAPHADGAHVKLMAAKSKVVHESITLAKMSSTTSIGADTSIQTNMDHARVSAFIGKPSSSLAMPISITQPVQRGEKLTALDGLMGAGSSGPKAGEEVRLSSPRQKKGIREFRVRVRVPEGDCSNEVHIVSKKGMVSGTSLTISRISSRDWGRWKRRAREKMVVDGGGRGFGIEWK
ncbi:hypothetical protein ACOSP7_031328 [Xanthoceras sorbifolium]